MRGLLIGIAWVLGCGLSPGALAEEEKMETPEGVLAEAWGPVEVMPLDAEGWQPAKAGLTLNAGDSVRTGKRGRAFIRLRDDVELRLGSDSIVEIQLEENTDRRRRSLALLLGVLLTKVATLGGAENPFEVHTANAVAGVRGTEFTTAVALDGAVRAAVQEGKLVLESEGGEVELTPGQFSEAEAEQAPWPAAEDPGVDWEAWREQRAEKILARASETGLLWIENSGQLRARLRALDEKSGKLNRELLQLAQKARLARHGQQPEAQRRIRERMAELVRESVELRRQERRLASRLRAATELIGRLVALAQERGTLPPEVLQKIQRWQERGPDLRKQGREIFRRLREEMKMERREIRRFQLRYRDLLQQKQEIIRERVRQLQKAAPDR